jgi:DNA-binding GntR family transcriptional regulator
MSAPPITEALKRLENEGLLKTIPRIGAKVTVPSPTEIRRIMEVREALECQAARLCHQHAKPAQKVELEQLAGELDKLMLSDEPAANGLSRFRRADRELHLKIAESGEADRLCELLRQTLTAYQSLANLVPVRKKPSEAAWHEPLIHTIFCSNVDEAEAAMRAHVRHALEGLLIGLQDYMVWDEKRLVDVWTQS